jgi:DNA ligase (NAD+)
MIALRFVENPADLYGLTQEQLAQLPGFKEKSVANLMDSIEASKARPFSKVLFALGIRHVGESIAELLAGAFGSIEALEAAPEEEISAIQGIGPEIAHSVRSYFEVHANHDLVRRLQNAGLQFRAARSAEPSGPFAGKSFVITGTLPAMSRIEATEFIEKRGGKVISSVSSKTSYLLVGDDPGSKLRKAQDLGVPHITEKQLRSLAGEEA